MGSAERKAVLSHLNIDQYSVTNLSRQVAEPNALVIEPDYFR